MESLKFIPQLFYDLIARVVPGSVVIYFISTAVGFQSIDFILRALQGAPALQDSALVLVLIYLAMSYVVGLLLTPSSGPFSRIARMLRPSDFRVLESILKDGKSPRVPQDMAEFYKKHLAIDNGVPASAEVTMRSSTVAALLTERVQALQPLWADPYTHISSSIFSWVTRRDPEIGAILVKMSAEGVFYRNLCMGVSIAFLLHLFAVGFMNVSLSLTFLFCSFVIALISILALALNARTISLTTLTHFYWANKELIDGKVNPLSLVPTSRITDVQTDSK